MAKVVYSQRPPRLHKFLTDVRLKKIEKTVLLYDRRHNRNPAFAKWKTQFESSVALSAGEGLKTLSSFEKIMSKILPMVEGYSRQQTLIVAVGGGSVGDFSGFIASTLKRGVNLVHVPTTWLAAIDSSHGGKTALNLAGFKNQVGTFYEPAASLIVHDFLRTQSAANEASAWGELLKIAWIHGGELQRKVLAGRSKLWSLLPLAVTAKLKITRQDFKESGRRKVLNLGHTMGHVLEAHWSLPHGMAVAYGMLFAIRWSAQRSLLKPAQLQTLMEQWQHCGFSEQDLLRHLKNKPISRAKLRRYLLQDKKSQRGTEVDFVFVHRAGDVRTRTVSIDSVVAEAVRQGWLKH